jgi:4-hydroxymandelate oxidase
MGMLSPRELEAEAQRQLDRNVYDFVAGGAGDEVTLRANELAFARIGLLPRVLRGAGSPELTVNLLGCAASLPVLIAPTAFHRLAHPEGERATARAAAACDAIMIVSMASTVAIEDVAAAARDGEGRQPSLWFQLYIQPDLGFTRAIVERAEAAGCRALVVSVDSPVFGRRERDLRNGFTDLPADLCCENLREPEQGHTAGRVRSIVFSPELTWRHVDWLRGATSLPIVLKGVVHPEDARLALEHGADALAVSNHGGRQLDTVPAAIDLLPAVVDAVAGRAPILLDGGVRRGTDIVKALAMGASAVAIGRPVLWALTVGGQHGVVQLLRQLRSELEQALTLTGCGNLRDLDRSLLCRMQFGVAT